MGTGHSYYIRQGRDIQGPFPRTRILEWIDDGKVRPEMMLSENGKTWFDGRSMPELFQAAESTALTLLYYRVAELAEGPVEARVLRKRHGSGRLSDPLLVSANGERWYEWDQLDRVLLQAGAPVDGPGFEQSLSPGTMAPSRLLQIASLLLVLVAGIANSWCVATVQYVSGKEVTKRQTTLGYFNLQIRVQRGDDDPSTQSASYEEMVSATDDEDSPLSEDEATTTRVLGALLFGTLGITLLTWTLAIVLQLLPPWAGQTFLRRAPRASQVTLLCVLTLAILFSTTGLASEMDSIFAKMYSAREKFDADTGWGISIWILLAALAAEAGRILLVRRNRTQRLGTVLR